MANVITITGAGTSTWAIPIDCPAGTSITSECWGAGSGASGRSGSAFGAGGAGGAYASGTHVVTAAEITTGNIAYTIGAGSAGTNNANPSGGGGDTTFGTNNANIFQNSTYLGTVSGTPGTLPTNAVYSGTLGLSKQIVGFGTDGGTGLPYIDIRFFGNTTATSNLAIFFDQAIPVGVLQYTVSGYVAVVAGAKTNLTSVYVAHVDAQTSAGAYVSTPLATANVFSTISSTLTRSSATATFPATSALAALYFQVGGNTGLAVDCTFRLAGLQLEQAAAASTFASTPVITMAKGGGAPSATTGGVGGVANSSGTTLHSVGYDLAFSGGSGAAFNANGSGGGGAGGKDGVGAVGTTAGVGGQGDSSTGGAGGTVATVSPGNAGTANAEGGGGGGSLKTATSGTGGAGGAPGGGAGAAVTAGTATGGAGAAGQIRLTYTPQPFPTMPRIVQMTPFLAQ